MGPLPRRNGCLPSPPPNGAPHGIDDSPARRPSRKEIRSRFPADPNRSTRRLEPDGEPERPDPGGLVELAARILEVGVVDVVVDEDRRVADNAGGQPVLEASSHQKAVAR